MFYDVFDSLCKEKGVKPTRACIEAGLSRGLASKWKSEKTMTPDTESLKKLSAYFGKSIEGLLQTDEKIPPAVQWNSGNDPVTNALIQEVLTASEEDKRKILEIIRVIKSTEH